jgi:flagellar operon protein
MERLQTRNIRLSKEDLSKINEAVNKAAEKGVKETLIIMGNSAFIANVKNRMIITAASEENLKNNVFTNIDGAVII